jgi:hypothetical protein
VVRNGDPQPAAEVEAGRHVTDKQVENVLPAGVVQAGLLSDAMIDPQK